MRDAERMKIVYGGRNLMCNASRQILTDNELALVEEREKVAAVEHLHHDVNRVLVLENVIKLDYVWVLADFEHFNFSLEQLKVFYGELFLFYYLNRALLSRLQMSRRLDEAIFTLAKIFPKLVVVVQACVARRALDGLDPLFFLLARREIVYTPLIGED